MQVDEGDRVLMSREEIENKIATLTGGRAAEELVFGCVTTGASNDIEQATKLARAAVTRYGMSEKFDMVALETVQSQYLGGDASLACSEKTAGEIDAEVIALVRRQHQKALDILKNDEPALHRLAGYLMEKETITGKEFMDILAEVDAGKASKISPSRAPAEPPRGLFLPCGGGNMPAFRRKYAQQPHFAAYSLDFFIVLV